MIRKITKEIEKLEVLKDKKEKEKATIITDLSQIDTKLKKLNALRKQCESLEADFNGVFGIEQKQIKEEKSDS